MKLVHRPITINTGEFNGDPVVVIAQCFGNPADKDDWIEIDLSLDQAKQVGQFLLDASKGKAPAKGSGSTQDRAEGFAEFWTAYPRKEAKAAALEVWKTRNLGPHLQHILTHVEAQKAGRQWAQGYIPMATTYLRQKRWEDIDSGGGELWNDAL